MSLFKFTNNISNNNKVELYNNGNHIRDFTYIDDLIQYLERIIIKKPSKDPPFEIFNIGSSDPKHLKEYLKKIEQALQKKADIKYMPMQKGDVHKTFADISKIKSKIGTVKKTSIDIGIKNFIKWYKQK